MSEKDLIECERLIMDLQDKFIDEFIALRKNKNLSQQKLAEEMGTIREKIARIESKMHSPSIASLINMLAPIGYTIKIVPINSNEEY